MFLSDRLKQFLRAFKQSVRIAFRLAFGKILFDRSPGVFPRRIRFSAFCGVQGVPDSRFYGVLVNRLIWMVPFR